MPLSDYNLSYIGNGNDPYVHPNGFYGASYPGTLTTLTLVSGTYYGSRFVAPTNFSSTGTVFRCITASGTDDPCEFLVHDGSTGARLATSGSKSSLLNGTGNRLATWSYSFLAATTYYIGFVATSTATISGFTVSNANLGALFGSGLGAVETIAISAFGIGNTGSITATLTATVAAISIRTA